MASLNNLKIFLEFEPIVKLDCYAFNCKFNLMNMANDSNDRMAACNLKQIIIGDNGQCLSFTIKKGTDES